MRLDFVCGDPKSQGLNVCDGVFARVSVRHSARKVRKFGDPASIFFPFGLDF